MDNVTQAHLHGSTSRELFGKDIEKTSVGSGFLLMQQIDASERRKPKNT